MTAIASVAVEVPRCKKCFSPLGRFGLCPALCEPVPQPPPPYYGPKVVGHTHLAKLGAPVWKKEAAAK